MPRGDQTGPVGAGPMTGRGAGWCAGNDAPGFASPLAGGLGRGLGRRGGRGGGRGWRNMFYATGVPGRGRGWPASATASPEQEIAELQAEAGWLERSLSVVKERLAALAKPTSASEH